MLETIKNTWKLPHIRKKLIFTVLMLMLVRVGTNTVLPFLDPVATQALMSGATSNPFQTLNSIMGSAFGFTVVFALGVTPYINSSIILQLLGIVFPSLEKLQREGESGKQKFERISRYTTFGLALVQAIAYIFYMNNVLNIFAHKEGYGFWVTAVTLVLVLMAGTAVVVFIGEEMTEKGIGSGISMIIFAGILSNMPTMFITLFKSFKMAIATADTRRMIFAPLLVILYFAMIVFVVYITQAERRIPIYYSKRQVGRKMYGGQSSYIPLKVNMSGVLPVIFASSFLSIPSLVREFLNVKSGGFWDKFLNFFNPSRIPYAILYFLLIFAFNYFYTTIQYNPVEIANNLRKSSGSIQGIRPGAPTAAYIQKVVNRITVMGGMFLGIVAVTPIIVGLISGLDFSMAGTSVIILVGVALETVRAIESQMTMRNYKGFLE